MTTLSKWFPAAVFVLLLVLVLQGRPQPVSPVPQGSVAVGSEYAGTTTPFVASDTVLCSTPGILGSVVVTGTNAGDLTLYDATTSNINLRTAGMASTTQRIAWLAANASSTTYTFDVHTYSGLLLHYSTNVATTTITYRCN